jgi:hypothetical protein
MRGTPRSLMLTWANTVAGWWTSTMVSAIHRQQRATMTATLNAMKPKPVRKRRARKRKTS